MGVKYNFFLPSASLTAGSDVLTLVPILGGAMDLVEVLAVGRGSTNVPYSLRLAQTTGGATPTGATGETPLDPDSFSDPNSQVVTAWGTQPTMAANAGVVISGSQIGGRAKWRTGNGRSMRARGTEQISIRAQTTGTIDLTVVWEDQTQASP